MPTPPVNTPEERMHALALALEARQARAEIKAQVASGDRTVFDVLEAGKYGSTDELGDHARVHGRIEIADLLLAVVGCGPITTAQILEEADVADPTEHLDKLNVAQRGAIVQALADRYLQ